MIASDARRKWRFAWFFLLFLPPICALQKPSNSTLARLVLSSGLPFTTPGLLRGIMVIFCFPDWLCPFVLEWRSCHIMSYQFGSCHITNCLKASGPVRVANGAFSAGLVVHSIALVFESRLGCAQVLQTLDCWPSLAFLFL